MTRKLNRDDLVAIAVRLRKVKEEMVSIGMVLKLDAGFDEEVYKLKTQVVVSNEVISSIEDKITDIDFPQYKK